MAKSRSLTFEDLIAWLERDDFPVNALNPIEEHTNVCLYRDDDGNHCIVGQFLTDSGFKYRDAWEAMSPADVLENLAERGKLRDGEDLVPLGKFLGIIQTYADAFNTQDRKAHPLPWGEVRDWILAELDKPRSEQHWRSDIADDE